MHFDIFPDSDELLNGAHLKYRFSLYGVEGKKKSQLQMNRDCLKKCSVQRRRRIYTEMQKLTDCTLTFAG